MAYSIVVAMFNIRGMALHVSCTVKKSFAVFPSIPGQGEFGKRHTAGDGKIANLSLQCTVHMCTVCNGPL
jgi:hypothetical protein